MTRKADLDFDPSAFIRSSQGLRAINRTYSGSVASLVNALGEQGGMAGDDDAGADFARMYNSAADGAIDGMAHALNLIGGGSQTSFTAAVTFMAADEKLAAQLRNANLIGGDGSPTSAPECDRVPLGRANGLPNVRGNTGWATRWIIGDLYRGSPDLLRSVASAWRYAERITGRWLDEVTACWNLVKPARGKTAEATQRFFVRLCGYEPCLATVEDGATLLANLPAACGQIAAACDRYADHVTAAKAKADSLTGELKDLLDRGPIGLIAESPTFGGNGEDGGLQPMMATDPVVTALAGIAHALDASRARVPVPRPESPGLPLWPIAPIAPGMPKAPGTSGGEPGVPAEPPVEPVMPEPVLVPLAFVMAGRGPTTPNSYPDPDPAVPYASPIPPPVPPEPGFPPLTPAQRKAFDTWAKTVPDKGFANRQGSANLDNAYQYRVSGYPEKLLTVTAAGGTGGYISADGLRDTDGMIVEAKRVDKPNECSTPRTLAEYAKAKPWFGNLYAGDRDELTKYRQAMAYGPNQQHLRGVEIVTNDHDSVNYWNAMMITQRVHGYARYAP